MEQRPLYALLLRLGAALSFATMALFLKLAGERGVSLPQLMVWRQLVPALGILGWLALTGGLGQLATKRLSTHARRGVLGMVGMVGNFASVLLLPLAESATLSFTTPLFAVLVGVLWFHDKVGPWRWTAVALGFAGVLVITQPGGAPVPALGVAAGLAAALAVALVSYQIRDLARTESTIAIVFYFSAFGAAIAALALPFTGIEWHGPYEWALLIAVGVAGTFGQLFVAASLRHGVLTSVIVMDYSSLIWATLYGWLAFDSLPPLATWLGAPLIVAAGLVIAWREHVLARRASPASAMELD